MKTVTSDGTNSVKTIEDIVVKVKATAPDELSDTQLAVVFLANTKLTTPPSKLEDVKVAQLESLVDLRKCIQCQALVRKRMYRCSAR